MDDVYISFLPLAHILDRMIEEFFFHRGASVGFYHGVSIFIIYSASASVKGVQSKVIMKIKEENLGRLEFHFLSL